MPRPKNTPQYVIWGTRGDDPDKVLKKTKTEISRSALSVTLGERLARRAPMPNIRGDRPEPHYSDE